MGDTRPCPFCAEPIKTAAVICRYCHSRLDGKEPTFAYPHRALHEDRAKKKAEAIATGEIPAAPPPPGPISSSSWTSIVVTLVLAVPGIVAAVVGNERDAEGCLAMSLTAAGFAFLFVVGFGIRDMIGPSVRKRSTPEEAAGAFYTAVKRGHYGRAWACVSPLDRTAETHSTLAIPLLSVDAKDFSFGAKSPFKKYWKSQCGLDDKGIGGYHKNLKYEILGTEQVRPGVAVVRARLRVGGYPSLVILAVLCALLLAVILMLVMRREETFEVRKVVYEKDGFWWMASGEFSDGEDAALEDLLRSPQA